MKQSPLTLLTGIVLVIIFALLLFTFQVRQTEVAVVTTFGRYSRTIEEPGFNWRLPWPIQKIYKFDNRIHSFEKKFEQTNTKDGRNLIVTVFVGWRIADPRVFLERFDQGNLQKAEQSLENLVRDAKSGIIGQHPFGDLISPKEEDLKFDQIESEMLKAIQPLARSEYGVEIDILGIKQLGLPESITQKVFERMRAERERLVKQFIGEGDAKAIEIRAEADRQREAILAEANAKATLIKGEADAEAAKSLQVFQQNPELAIFIMQLKALEQSLKERATLILDQQTTPFNIMNSQPARLPSVSGE